MNREQAPVKCHTYDQWQAKGIRLFRLSLPPGKNPDWSPFADIVQQNAFIYDLMLKRYLIQKHSVGL